MGLKLNTRYPTHEILNQRSGLNTNITTSTFKPPFVHKYLQDHSLLNHSHLLLDHPLSLTLSLSPTMSLLDQLWDETLAGPRPDEGLGKLRKQSTFTFRSSDSSKAESQGVEDPAMRVTRSIMIGKPVGNESQTPPASPAGSTPPVSPFPGGRSEAYRFRRKSTSEYYERATGIGYRSPRAPYDL
ncbi:putative dormancy/auxin associated protein [Helianthus debilis subsp. tardiflorus]